MPYSKESTVDQIIRGFIWYYKNGMYADAEKCLTVLQSIIARQ